MRPTTDKFMIIYHSNGTEANRFNITDPNIAIFSTAVDRTVTVTWGGSSGKFSFHLRVQQKFHQWINASMEEVHLQILIHDIFF